MTGAFHRGFSPRCACDAGKAPVEARGKRPAVFSKAAVGASCASVRHSRYMASTGRVTVCRLPAPEESSPPSAKEVQLVKSEMPGGRLTVHMRDFPALNAGGRILRLWKTLRVFPALPSGPCPMLK